MKSKFYLLFIFFSFCFANAQNQLDTKEAITEKLEYLKKNQSSLEPKKQETMLLQIKAASEKIAYEKGILLSGVFLMGVYDQQYKNKEVVELGNQLKKIIQNKKKDPSGSISSIYRINALALMYLGLDAASKKDVETAIRFAKTIDNPDRKYLRLTQCYMDLHSHYNNRKNQSKNQSDKDSTVYYLYKSLEVVKKINDNSTEIPNRLKYHEMTGTYIRLGVFYLEYSDENGNLKLAEKNLLAAEKIQKNKNCLSMREETVLVNQLSWLYMEKKEYNKSIEYANHALMLEKQDPRPTARVESFEFLATSYMETGNKEKSKFYMEKYTALKDSINTANRKNADTTMTKMLTKAESDHKEDSKNKLIVIGSLALIFTLVTIIFWRRRNRILRKSYEEMIEKLTNEYNKVSLPEKTAPQNTLNIERKFNIHDNTINQILSKLDKFEKSERFLKKDMSLTYLANMLDTNPNYLSMIINQYKDKNFNNYLNGLRINHLIKLLYKEPLYREYKIAYLSEYCGFISRDVFGVAFKKETGMTPSYFINQLKTDLKSNEEKV